MKKMNKLDVRDAMVRMMETGYYTPLQGWRHLKATYNQMSIAERNTDGCRAMIALDIFDATDFGNRIA